MGSVIVHNGEYFERGKMRYVVFSVTLIILIVASVWFGNLFGAIILFFLVGGYILFALMKNKKTTIKLSEQGVLVGEKVMPWLHLQGWSIEADVATGGRKNIVFVTKNDKMIFTFDDTVEHVQAFANELGNYLPVLDSVPFTFLEKLTRKMKL